MADRKITMGLIVGNRGFFPGHLAETGREEMLRAMKQAGIEAVVLPTDQSNHGAIESYEEAKRCAAHFRAHADAIPGLEIQANDVRCTHAAAIAQVDPEQLYYLRSHGLPESDAKRLVIEGFLAALVERFEAGPMREVLGEVLERRLDAIL